MVQPCADAGHDVLQDAPRRARGTARRWSTTVAHAGSAAPGSQVRGAAAGRSAGGAASAPCRRGRRNRRARRRSRSAQILVGLVGDEDRDQTLAIVDDIAPVEDRIAPCRRASCRATATGRAAHRPAGRSDRPAPTMPSARSRRQPTISADAGHLGGFMRADDAGERVAVGDGERLDADRGGLGEQFLAGRRAAQEREMRRDLELDIAGHREDPVQVPTLRSPVAASSPSPARKIQKRSPASSSTWK